MSVRIITGDCREVLRTLPAESVHCCVTSPPYWGLRDYGTAKWEGGDPGCDHKAPQEWIDAQFNANSAFGAGAATQSAGGAKRWYRPDGSCRCGARRIDSQIGLESSFTDYVAVMVEVFREVRRVLRRDGTAWMNLGDSYAANRSYQVADNKHTFVGNDMPMSVPAGLKPKDLCGIPWRVAFALQADGWWLRSEIIWAKPNPMPESVTDRPTKAHETIFLLTKNPTYYYDAEAIREEAEYGRGTDPTGRMFNRVGNSNKNAERVSGAKGHTFDGGRNRRTVWEIATSPFPEAHFATFPPALVEPCIKAGCPEKCCGKCGAGWVREVEENPEYRKIADTNKGWSHADGPKTARQKSDHPSHPWKNKTIGFSPSCSCNAETKPGTVLDPFGGAGTSGLVADRLGRNAVLIELNPEYAAMAHRRIVDDAPLLVVAAE